MPSVPIKFWGHLVKPTSKQTVFCESVFKDQKPFTLYGGARGGGKSYIIRWALVWFLIDVYMKLGIKDCIVGLFCETFPAVKNRHILKAKAEFPNWLGRWSDTDFILSEEFGRGRIRMLNLDDAQKYRSAEFAAAGVDEITRDTLEQIEEVWQSLRWPGVEFNPFFAGTNPGGLGHSWVKRLFIDKNLPEYMRKSEENPLGYTPDEFHYIPALPTDNPHLSQQYLRRLYSLPEPLRSAVLKGDWNAFAGQYFNSFTREGLQCKPFKIPESWQLMLAMDPGWGGICSAGLFAIEPWNYAKDTHSLIKGKVFEVSSYHLKGANSEQRARDVHKMIEMCPYTNGRSPDFSIAGLDAFHRRDKHAAIPSEVTMADEFERFGIYLEAAHVARGSRVQTFQNFRQYVDQRRFQIFEGEDDALLDEMESVQADEKNVEDIEGQGRDPKVQDHGMDKTRYALYAAEGEVLDSEPQMRNGNPKGDGYGGHDLSARELQSQLELGLDEDPWSPGLDTETYDHGDSFGGDSTQDDDYDPRDTQGEWG